MASAGRDQCARETRPLARFAPRGKCRMSTALNMIAVLFLMAVVVVLVRGLANLMRGGSGNTSNKLMQARIILQFVALVFILLAFYVSRG